MQKARGRIVWVRTAGAALCLLALAACGQSDDAQGVGGLSKSEADALNRAASMLDEQANDAQAALNGNAAE